MKLAIIHDYLCGMGGSERMFQYMCEAFPDADAYALAYNPDATLPFFRSRKIHTTWLNRFVQSTEAFRWSFPIATHVMESLDLSGYDLVLSSSATVAKYVRVPNGRHCCYCYIPTRALWQAGAYFANSRKRALIKPVLSYLQRRDYAAAQRVDHFISISRMSQAEIKSTYHRDSDIIFCPIDLARFAPAPSRGEHYLLVSRLEKWKRIDYAIEAFNQLGAPLRVIGTGEEAARLQAMAGPNISFLGAVDDDTLAREYGQARAVVFTPFLEYGLIPLEANASGTPVICYGHGGVTETMVPCAEGVTSAGHATAVFFDEQTPAALIDAVRRFEKVSFDPSALVAHASQWGVPEFKRKLRAVMDHLGQQR